MLENNSFEKQPKNKGEEFMNAIAQEKRNKWHELLVNTDMKHSIKKAWGLIKGLNSDPVNAKRLSNITRMKSLTSYWTAKLKIQTRR